MWEMKCDPKNTKCTHLKCGNQMCCQQKLLVVDYRLHKHRHRHNVYIIYLGKLFYFLLKITRMLLTIDIALHSEQTA